MYFISKVLVSSRTTRSPVAPVITSELYIPQSRLVKYGDKNCYYFICHVLNALPADIGLSEHFLTCRSKQKTWLSSTS